MQHNIYDEQTGISYTLQGDYYLPDLTLPPEEEKRIGVWGQRHARYLKEYHKVRYINLLTRGKLNCYLADIDEQAEEMFFRLVEQMKEQESITEKLKSENPLCWIGKMNNIRNRAEESINQELIFA